MIREIQERQALVGDVVHEESGNIACVVVEAKLAGPRAAWVDEAARMARAALRAGDAAKALAAAETAFNLDARMTPHGVALLACAHRKNGKEQRADGYLRMAERSMGTTFATEVREELVELNPQAASTRPFHQLRLAALRKAPLMRRAS